MISAHGLGGGDDLPIPATMAVAAGTAAVVVSFVVLLLAWRKPRFSADGVERRCDRLGGLVDSAAFALAGRLLGLAFFGFTLVAAVAGKDDLQNPTFGLVYVVLWVGIVPASLLLGPFFKAISPVRTLHLLICRVIGRDPEAGVMPYPPPLGYWPSAVGLLAFVWLELVSLELLHLSTVQAWFGAYIAAMVTGALLFGGTWFERADPFEVYSSLVGRLSVWGRGHDGTLVVRSPLRNLAALAPAPGLVAVVSVLLGSTAYDSITGSARWVRLTQDTTMDVEVLGTLVLLACCLSVALTFAAAVILTRVDPDRSPRSMLPAQFAHSLAPIIVGYVIAHYLTYFYEEGQRTLIQVSDPLGTGANIFGTAEWEITYWLALHPTELAVVKVLAIVVGHILGVMAAHDRALQVLPSRAQVTGQIPLLLVMVVYTCSGLFLLLGL